MSANSAFHSLKVAEVRRETRDAVSIGFEVPEGLKDLFQFKAGQYLTVRTELDGQDVRRNYSVCVSPLDGELRIAVKQVAGGQFSTFANTALRAGQSLELMPPMGRFTLPEPASGVRRYVGFAGGSGITPVLSLLKTTLLEDPQSRFALFYGNRSTATVMFLEELAGLKNRFMERLEIYHFLEDEHEDIDLFNGRIDKAKAEEILATLVKPEAVTRFFVCGPGPMMDGVEAALKARGVEDDRILIERFSTTAPTAAQLAQAEALQQKAQGARITVTLDGRRAVVSFDAEKGNVLDSVQAAGLPAPYACKGGVCATCRAKVVEGEVTMKTNYGLTEEEVAQGYVLTCQSVPITDTVVLDYDA